MGRVFDEPRRPLFAPTLSVRGVRTTTPASPTRGRIHNSQNLLPILCLSQVYVQRIVIESALTVDKRNRVTALAAQLQRPFKISVIRQIFCQLVPARLC